MSAIAAEPLRPVASPATGRARDALILAALVVVGTILCLVRVPAYHHDIVWAEDANIFLFENLNLGGAETLFRGYAGYQHLVPRILSGIILAFAPLSAYAVVVFWTCSVVTGLIGAAVYWLSRDVVAWVPARVALALLTFVLPLATQEVIGNVADIHTYFMWLAPWLFFFRPRSWGSASAWAVVAFLTIMTEVQSILFLPLALLVLRRSRRRSWPIAGAFVAGAAWQVATVVTVERDSSAAWLGIPSIVQGWLINTVMPLLVADPMAVRAHLQSSGLLIPLIVLIPFVVAFVVAMIWGSGQQRIVVLTLALASAAIYSAGAVVDGSWWFRYAESDAPMWERIINVRYGVSSGLMLTGIVPIAASALCQRRWRQRGVGIFTRAVAWAAIVGLIAVLAVASTRAVSTRNWVDGQWSPSVEAATQQCEGAEAGAKFALPVAPERVVMVTCEQLRR
jgi:hypothetical protein